MDDKSISIEVFEEKNKSERMKENTVNTNVEKRTK